MAFERLNVERAAKICEELRTGKTVGTVARVHRHDRRTVERVAREHGIEVKARRIHVSEEQQAAAAKLLETSKATMGQIARSFGMGRSTLKRRLHAAGVQGHGPHLRPAEIARIDALLAQGHPVQAVARAIGRHRRTVERYRARRHSAAPMAQAI